MSRASGENQRNDERPQVSAQQAVDTLRTIFNANVVEGSIKDLVSYDDRNFYVRLVSDRADITSNGEYVLKFHNGVDSVDTAFIDCQNKAISHLSSNGFGVGVVIPSVDGNMISHTPFLLMDGKTTRQHAVRLLTFVPGQIMLHAPLKPAFLPALGRYMGRVDQALLSFDHPATHREFEWDLANMRMLLDAPDQSHVTDGSADLKQKNYIELIADEGRRKQAQRWMDVFLTEVEPKLKSLRQCVLQNDMNEQNLIVTEDGCDVATVIDFGDLVHTALVCELSICLAYLLMLPQEALLKTGGSDPLDACVQVIAGYHAVLPLEEGEWDVLVPLTAARIVVSLALGNYAFSRDPSNEYLAITQEPSLRALELLSAQPHQELMLRWKRGCGVEV